MEILILKYYFQWKPLKNDLINQKKLLDQQFFLVGAGGFEPPTSRTRTVHSIRTEPRPEQRTIV